LFKIEKLIWKNLLFLQIILQRDAGSNNGGELDVVHDAGAGVGRDGFFQDFFAYQANGGGQTGQSRSFHNSLHELVVGHGYIKKIIFSINKNHAAFSSP